MQNPEYIRLIGGYTFRKKKRFPYKTLLMSLFLGIFIILCFIGK